jgi:cell division inhibitor SepF
MGLINNMKNFLGFNLENEQEQEYGEDTYFDAPESFYSQRARARVQNTQPAYNQTAQPVSRLAQKTQTSPVSVSKKEKNSSLIQLPLKNRSRDAFPEISSLVIVEPKIYEDSLSISSYLKEGKPVIVNLKHLDPVNGKRLIDFVCGTAYAFEGNMQKIGQNIFLFTPSSVNIVDHAEPGMSQDFGQTASPQSPMTEQPETDYYQNDDFMSFNQSNQARHQNTYYIDPRSAEQTNMFQNKFA